MSKTKLPSFLVKVTGIACEAFYGLFLIGVGFLISWLVYLIK
ncbi:MAG: hypothetical protein PHQ96_04150 [Candidatus Omnitrophica bacterium]|nr:hypothetical protein [Candidatus Omnitrophota bacterium]